MSTILDTKYADVVFEDGVLKLEVPAKAIALAVLKPQLDKLKAAIPGEIDDALIDKIMAAIEAL